MELYYLQVSNPCDSHGKFPELNFRSAQVSVGHINANLENGHLLSIVETDAGARLKNA